MKFLVGRSLPLQSMEIYWFSYWTRAEEGVASSGRLRVAEPDTIWNTSWGRHRQNGYLTWYFIKDRLVIPELTRLPSKAWVRSFI